jgi:preprotein translocase subunit SecG
VDRFEVRLSITKLLIVLIVIIVPLSVVGLVLTSRSDRSLDNAIGSDYKALAQTYSNDVSDFFRDRVADVNAMAADSSVLAAVAGHATAKKGGSTGSQGQVNGNASEFLRERRILDPRYLNVVVTDMNGDVVASAGQPPKTDYSQDEFWQSVYNKGQGTVKISEILDNELMKAYFVNIGFPISDSSGNFIGVLSAAVNISPLLSRFQQNEIGNGAHAALVDENGTIVSAPNMDVFARGKSVDFDAVRDTSQGQQAGWTLASVRGGPDIVGYASTGLKKNFDNLGWFVLVSQKESLAAAPIRELERFALVMVILGIFMLTLLCVYWYLHHKQRFEYLEAPAEEGTGRTAAASV